MTQSGVIFKRFASFGGMQADPSTYATCVQPAAPAYKKRGALAVFAEPVGSAALEGDACRLAQRTVIERYFSDHALGLTSALLNALDAANNSLLQFSAGWSDEQPFADSHGVSGEATTQTAPRTRKARVGLTAVLIRPDGTGVYLSQIAPTQAYLLHNGVLAALPEPPAWRPAPGRRVITLKRPGEEEVDETEVESLGPTETPEVPLAPPLGSGPGLEADLIYRRVSPGDRVILVSTGLARYIERAWADEAFTSSDPETVIDALHELAQQHGLPEAHACVLEFGASVASGVDTDYTAPVAPKPSSQVAHDGGASAVPVESAQSPAALLRDLVKGPKGWLTRRGSPSELEPEAHEAPPSTHADAHSPDLSVDMEEEEEIAWSREPTRLFVQPSPEVPPYAARKEAEQPGEPQPHHPPEELEFDGWEDAPPALDNPRFSQGAQVIYKPQVHNLPLDADPPAHEIATEDDFASPGQAAPAPASNMAAGQPAGPFKLIMPIVEQARARFASLASSSWTRARLPLRLVIVAAMVIAGLLLALSLINMRGSSEQALTRNLLADAQALEAAANQAGVPVAERVQKLQLAIDKVNEALEGDPKSAEALRLLDKLNTELDTAQGVTRLAQLRVLFDLDTLEPGPTTNGVPPSTAARGSVLVQGNDLYYLDRGSSKLYRCAITAKSCSVALSAGDTVGGQKVGAITHMTLRVGSLLALDEALVSYLFSADTGAWTAEPLGDAASLKSPAAIATYDGNLYLLGARGAGILKYPSGLYAQPPIDWITDGPSADQVKSPAGMAIDGSIYLVLEDGKVLMMQGGKLAQTFTPRSFVGAGTPTELFTGTDVRDLYLLRSDGSVTRMSKEGQTLAILRPPQRAEVGPLSGLMVDEGRGKLYLASGRKIYEATLPAAPKSSVAQPETKQAPQAPAPQPAQAEPVGTNGSSSAPAVRPTAEP